jgi:hypothetical protein
LSGLHGEVVANHVEVLVEREKVNYGPLCQSEYKFLKKDENYPRQNGQKSSFCQMGDRRNIYFHIDKTLYGFGAKLMTRKGVSS